MIIKKQPGVVMVPEQFLWDPMISLEAKGLYAYLLTFRAPEMASIAGIAMELNHRDQVEAAARELEAAGYIADVK